MASSMKFRELVPDRQVGETCWLNEKNTYLSFHADLKDFQVLPGDVESDAVQRDQTFIASYKRIVGKTALLSFIVYGENEDRLERNISSLISESKECTIKRESAKMLYRALLTNYSMESTGIDFLREVTFHFLVSQHLPKETHVFTGSKKIWVDGTAKADCIITIVPKSDLASFSILGITVQNLKAGIPFIIDGISRKVSANGINRWGDTNLVDFPSLSPGFQQIAGSADAKVVIEYYPTFI